VWSHNMGFAQPGGDPKYAIVLHLIHLLTGKRWCHNGYLTIKSDAAPVGAADLDRPTACRMKNYAIATPVSVRSYILHQEVKTTLRCAQHAAQLKKVHCACCPGICVVVGTTVSRVSKGWWLGRRTYIARTYVRIRSPPGDTYTTPGVPQFQVLFAWIAIPLYQGALNILAVIVLLLTGVTERNMIIPLSERGDSTTQL
jgi:hypothetical protein